MSDQMADQVGDRVRLAGAGGTLDGDAAMLGQPAGDGFLLGVGRQRHEEPLGVQAPRLVVVWHAFAVQSSWFVGDDRDERGGHVELPGHERVPQFAEEPPVERAAPAHHQHPGSRDRRVSARGGRHRGVDDAAILAERSEQLLVQDPVLGVERPDRGVAEPFADVEQQVEPVQLQALQQLDVHVMRNERFWLHQDRAGLRVE